MSCLSVQDWIGESEMQLSSLVAAKLAVAQAHDWGALVDAYLVDAAEVGDRFVAYVYGDRSEKLVDGMTIVTPPSEVIAEVEGMALLRSVSGNDHYVMISRLPAAA
ncbi:hypothetical protein [Pseudomonas fulva]|uniref:hypothetical protein n=1 Tax=Pseudomonas fulva TaxID=47880 RepID=UPI001F38B48E|nr:hypothetical protein [Pseudomonas fulva]